MTVIKARLITIRKIYNNEILHEPNPYKKNWRNREALCSAHLQLAEARMNDFWNLLRNHYRSTKLKNGDHITIICSFGADDASQVDVANLAEDRNAT